ncbi:unnamed protein product [Blumeria hordei]|uniref:Kinesin-like protein n=1 Tax=Blumeria hordei TaxID=2867405 RepID=A0A383V059_BLUHO|nr:unnamed protein product [Blumeria hordei]
MDIEDNSHRSQLPQPVTKAISPERILSDVTDSQKNAHIKLCYAPSTNLKHKITPFGEPDAKRKTLLSRLADSRSNAIMMPGSARQPLKGIPQGRSKSSTNRSNMSLSSFSRLASEPPRNSKSSGLSCSVGPESRPASLYAKSHVSKKLSQSTSTRPTANFPRPRPATSAGSHEPEFDRSKCTREEWDVQGRLQTMEAQFMEIRETMKGASLDKKGLEESVALLKTRNAELESLRCQLSLSNQSLQSELDSMRHKYGISQQSLLDMTKSLDDQIRSQRIEMENLRWENRNEVEKIRRENTEEIDSLSRLHRDQLRESERKKLLEHEESIREIERRNNAILEKEKARNLAEIQLMEQKLTSESNNLDLTLQNKDREIMDLKSELDKTKGDLERERTLKTDALHEIDAMKEVIRKTNLENATTVHSMEHTLTSLRSRILFLESGSKAQSDSFADMESRLEEAIESAKESQRKLIKEESLRRFLFNQVQELKGNIRVMCRVRPVLNNHEGEAACLRIPDEDKHSRELELAGKEEKTSLGTISKKIHSFTFDRVFGPNSQNHEIFEEISQLVQSALDGYNVCIFCYGQTGSGKTHTMSSPDGMIPRAAQQIYKTATELREKGWTYKIEGNFVEVYNEEIHDLLGNHKEHDKKKHEIRHDDQKKQTTVTGLNTVKLDSPDSVESILKDAAGNRSVAATKSNERSSRSHSVFILKLVGHNSTTGESCEGTLNLVDLAGSERLKQSGAEGERKKETQSINKSLSCLSDVIGALGQGKEGTHIPYRNSKLTYLLQYSLGGNSKTLMFVMTSPLEAHVTETLTSLKFATKVHNTHIGTAKKTKKLLNES